jgi:conjugative relaxase-like TrwC/TraI family protein
MLTMSDEITTSEHRAAWDTSISAPKSVSLRALVADDGRIRDAYRESINKTVKEFEKYLQARALKKGKDSTPDLPPESITKVRTKTKSKQRTPTSSLMTYRSMNL